MPVIKMLSRVADGSVDLKLLFSRETLARLLHQMNDPAGSSYNLKPMSKYTYMSALVRVLDLPSVQRLFCSEADQQQLQVLRKHIAEAKQEFMRQAEGSRKPKARAPAAAAGSGGKRQKQQQQQQQQLQHSKEAAQQQQQQQQAELPPWFVGGLPAALAAEPGQVAAAAAAMAMALQQLHPAAMAPAAPRVAAAPGSMTGADAVASSDATAALGSVDAAAATTSDDGSRLRRSRRQQQQLAETDLLLMQQLQQSDQQGEQQQEQQEEEQEESVPAPVALRTVEDLRQLLTSVKGADKVAQQSVATLLSPIKSWSAACGGCSDLRTLFLGGAVSGASSRSSSRAKAGFDGMLQLLQARVARDELSPATAAMHMYSLLSVLQLPAVQEQLFASQAEWQQMRARVDIAKKYFLAMDKAAKAAAAAAEDQWQWQRSKRRKVRSTAATNSSSSHLAAVATAASEQQQWDWYAAAAAAAAAPAASAFESIDQEAAAVLASLACSHAASPATSPAAASHQQARALQPALPHLVLQLADEEQQQEQARTQQALLLQDSCKASATTVVPALWHWQDTPTSTHQEPQRQRPRPVLMLGDPQDCEESPSSLTATAGTATPAPGAAGAAGPRAPAAGGHCVPANSSADAAHSGSSNSALPEAAAVVVEGLAVAVPALEAASDGISSGNTSGIDLNDAETALMALICKLQPDAGLRCAALQRLDAAMLLLRGAAAAVSDAAAAAAAAAAAGDEQPTAAASATAALLSFKTDYMRVVIWRDNGMAASSVLGAVDRLMDNISAKAAGAVDGGALKTEC